METSITSEMISQQTICGDKESLELTNDTEYSKEKTELEKMQSNFKYSPSQKIACTKATVRKRVMMGVKIVPSPHQPRTDRKGKTPKIGIKNLEKVTGVKHSHTQEEAQMILTWYPSIKRNKKISENDRVTHTKNVFPKSG